MRKWLCVTLALTLPVFAQDFDTGSKPYPVSKEFAATARVLRACAKRVFVSQADHENCMIAAQNADRRCGGMRLETDACVRDMQLYLQSLILQKMGAGARLSLTAFRRWWDQQVFECKGLSGYTPEGVGYNHDIQYCTAKREMLLLRKGLNTKG